MSKLYLGDTLISDKVRTSSPNFEGDNVITHRLLNGKKNIQNIGELSQTVEVSCLVTEDQKDLIDRAIERVEMFRLARYGVYLYGFINDYPSIEQFRNSLTRDDRLYKADFILNVEDDTE